MPIIQVNNLTKEYHLGNLSSLRETALNTLRRISFQPVKKREQFKALDNISFTIEEGEVVGIIGHNGAGKSTLLKHLANISKPTSGKVIVKGSVAPLIEVGAGVNPELTGRENIFLNAAILGVPKRIIRQKLDDIIEFSELEQFIDTPVKRYSSGMTVKLGFSIATSMEADILIVDEVLAVGDLAFQRKCFDRMEDLIRRQGKTVLLVSHNIRQVERICKRVILLEKGRLIIDDESKIVCDEFYTRSQSKISETLSTSTPNNGRWESTGEVELTSIDLENNLGNKVDSIETGSDFSIHIRIKIDTRIENISIGLGLHTTDFVYLTTHNSEVAGHKINLLAGEHDFCLKVKHLPLLPGVYMVRIGITCGEMHSPVFYGENLLKIQVVSPKEFRIPSSMQEGFFNLNASWDMPTNNKQLESIQFEK